MVVHAIYENGVFRPKQPIDLPEHCEVQFEPRVVDAAATRPASLDDLYEILSRSHETGEHDLAARHDEHQP